MGRKKQQEPEQSDQQAPDTQQEQPTVTKADAVRQAITELGGPDAIKDNAEVVEMVRKLYRMEVTSQDVSLYKSKMKKAPDDHQPRQRRTKDRPSLAQMIRPIREAAGAVGGWQELQQRLKDAVTLEDLANNLGYDSVKALAEDVDALSELFV